MKNVDLSVLNAIDSKFSDRIVSLVGYGSYFFDRSHNDSDIDLCLLLDTRDHRDLIALRDIIATNSASRVDITIHYLDEVEQRGWENFNHGTHGVFFLHHLANAIVLRGNDIFARKPAQVPMRKYKESLITQIYQYIDRIQIQLIHDPSTPIDFFRKYLTRMMIDMLLLESDISYREVNKNSALGLMNNFIITSTIFSDKSKEFYRKIMTENVDCHGGGSITLQYVVTDFQKQLNRVGKDE